MSEPKCYANISIYNKKLYAFLLEYAERGCFKKDNLIITSSSGKYPMENLSSMTCHNTDNLNYKIDIFDPFYGNVDNVPEGVYDIVPCLLIHLGYMFRWDQGNHDSFATFRDDFLSKKADIEKHFDKVLWEVEWIDNRYSWDGIYKWTEKFCYDRFQDESEHTKTVYKLGLDLEDNLINRTKDVADDELKEFMDYERSRAIESIKERSKYYNYDWNSLNYCGKVIEFPSFNCTDLTEFDFSDED